MTEMLSAHTDFLIGMVMNGVEDPLLAPFAIN